MKNIFLAPRSNNTAAENFESTVIQGRTYSEIESYLNNEEKQILSQYKNLSIWGAKASVESKWKKMLPGDFVLFYQEGNFSFRAEVVLKKKNVRLAKKLWNSGRKSEPWPLIFFIKHVKKINLPLETIQRLGGYSSGWNKVQGFMRLNDTGTHAIVDQFGSLKNFLSQDQKLFESLNEFAESYTEESLDIPSQDIGKIDKKVILKKAIAYTYTGPSHKSVQVTKKQRIENQQQKERVAQLEDYRCQVCEWSLSYINAQGKKVQRIDIDHIIEKSKGGGEELSNLWALCPNCHAKKTAGVITIDVKNQIVKENGNIITIKDNHLFINPEI